MRKILSILSLSAMLMAGCQKEDSTTPDNNANYPADGAVRIETPINTPVTSATPSDYAGSDLSLTVDYGDADKYTKNNIEWTKTGEAWSTADQMLWKDATTTANIYAYAPYVAAQSDLTVIPFSAQADQSAGLTSSDLVGYVKNNFTPGSSLTTKNAIPIAFDHKMAKLNIKLSFGDEFGATAPAVTSVSLLAKNSVTYNAKTAAISPVTGEAVVITPNKADNANYSVIVAPQEVAMGVKLFTIEVDGAEYTYTTAETHTFATNKATTISLRIGKDKITLAKANTVGDWRTGAVIPGGEAVPPIMLADFGAGGRYETAFPEGDTWVIADEGAPNYAAFRVLVDRLHVLARQEPTRLINLEFPNLTELPDAEKNTGVLSIAYNLKSFDAPNLTKIGTYAFSQCSNLTGNLIIPNSVTMINMGAFANCSMLKIVTCLGNTPPTINDDTFGGTTALTSILVPSTSVAAYQKATNWSKYAAIISAIPQP